jgi:hypothetical protein
VGRGCVGGRQAACRRGCRSCGRLRAPPSERGTIHVHMGGLTLAALEWCSGAAAGWREERRMERLLGWG